MQKWPMMAFVVYYHLHEDWTLATLRGSRFATQVQAYQAFHARVPQPLAHRPPNAAYSRRRYSDSDAPSNLPSPIWIPVPSTFQHVQGFQQDSDTQIQSPFAITAPKFPSFLSVDGFELDVGLLLSIPPCDSSVDNLAILSSFVTESA